MDKIITLAGGCFWGTEKFLSYIQGVTATEVGYANGKTSNPTYKEVCSGTTGFAEAVSVSYDESKISLAFLLRTFFHSIDPTQLNRQGNDVGTQYRTGIYFSDARDKPIIQDCLTELQNRYSKPLAIESLPLNNFYPAEEYHQKYLDKNPMGYCHVGPNEFSLAKNAKDPNRP